MKPRLLACAAALVIVVSGPLRSLEIGGTIDNATALTAQTDLSFSQVDKLSLWALHDFTEDMRFAVQASYTYSLQIPYIFDLDYAELSVAFPRLLGLSSLTSLSLGRFGLSDFSGYVLSTTIDGVFSRVLFPSLSLSAAIGYTGLLLKPVSSVLMSRSDLVDRSDTTVILGPPRLVEYVELTLSEVAFRQDVTVAAVFQQDLRPSDSLVQAGQSEESADRGGPVHTQYFGLGLSGPLVYPVYYDGFFYMETGSTLSYLPDSGSTTGYSYQASSILAWLSGAGVQLYFDRLFYSVAQLRFLLSAGDPDFFGFIEGNAAGDALMFLPVSSTPLSLVFSPLLGNMATIELSYSLRPLVWSEITALENIQTLVKAISFFRTVSGSISAPGVNPNSASRYLGTEVDFIVNARPLSDVGAAFAWGVFLPHNWTADAPLLSEEWPIANVLRLQVFLSF